MTAMLAGTALALLALAYVLYPLYAGAKSRVCPKCGSVVEADSTCCSNCGAPVAAPNLF